MFLKNEFLIVTQKQATRGSASPKALDLMFLIFSKLE